MSQLPESSPSDSATPPCPSTECSASCSDQTTVERENREVAQLVHTMQETLRLRGQLAATMSQGYHLLATARYKVGTGRVSASQLPGPESDHQAAVHVAADPDGHRSLEEEKGVTDPARLFGVLLPTEMRQAQKAFRQAALLSVQVANLQDELTKLKIEI